MSRLLAGARRRLGDPAQRASGFLLLLALAGFAVLGLAWCGAAATPYVPLQLPWLVSGGFVGLGVLGTALGAWSIHLSRRTDARHRRDVDGLVRDVTALAVQIGSGARPLPRRRRRRRAAR